MATKNDSAAASRLDSRPLPADPLPAPYRGQYVTDGEEPEEVLYQRLRQAHAMSCMVVGEGFDSFATYNEELQHEYLWALSSLLRDAVVASDRVCEARRARRESASPG